MKKLLIANKTPRQIADTLLERNKSESPMMSDLGFVLAKGVALRVSEHALIGYLDPFAKASDSMCPTVVCRMTQHSNGTVVAINFVPSKKQRLCVVLLLLAILPVLIVGSCAAVVIGAPRIATMVIAVNISLVSLVGLHFFYRHVLYGAVKEVIRSTFPDLSDFDETKLPTELIKASSISELELSDKGYLELGTPPSQVEFQIDRSSDKNAAEFLDLIGARKAFSAQVKNHEIIVSRRHLLNNAMARVLLHYIDIDPGPRLLGRIESSPTGGTNIAFSIRRGWIAALPGSLFFWAGLAYLIIFTAAMVVLPHGPMTAHVVAHQLLPILGALLAVLLGLSALAATMIGNRERIELLTHLGKALGTTGAHAKIAWGSAKTPQKLSADARSQSTKLIE